jgi:hypothetical protein
MSNSCLHPRRMCARMKGDQKRTSMNWRFWGMLGLAALIAYWMWTDPAGLGETVKGIGGGLKHAGNSIVTFIETVF